MLLKIIWPLVATTALSGGANAADQSPKNPVLRLKEMHSRTEVVSGGKPLAAIVEPSDPAGQQAARKLRDAIRERTGCELPLVAGREAWEKLWGRQNLIVVGNLMTNHAFAMLYCMHYACSDAAWPGQGGYEVRTICNPRGLGRNVVAIGGSDPEGVLKAVDAFLERVKPGPDLVLDPFIDTRVGGKIFEPLSEEAMGKASTNPVSQTMNYYRTGNPQYAELARRGYLAFVKQMAEQGTIAFTGAWEWHGICWDLLEEAPVFTDEERLAITNGLVTFMEKCPSAFAEIRDQDRPFHGVDMVTVHIYDTARYFEDYYRECEVARKILDRQRVYWKVQSRYWTQDCQSSWYQGSDGAYLAQYALQALDFTWFETGRFKRWLEWYVASCSNDGTATGFGDAGWGAPQGYVLWALQVGAWYYKEPWMQSIAELGGFARSDPNNLGFGFFTGEARPTMPLHLGDLHKIPLDDWMLRLHPASFPPERAFNKVSIQDGYKARAPYLLLEGTGNFPHGHPATNEIIAFTKNGRYLLFSGGYMVFQIVEHNVLGVYRNGEGSGMPSLAELRYFAQVPGGKFVQSVVNDYNGIEWSRNILWRDRGTAVVIDRATARKPGSYGFQLVWRCNPTEVDRNSRSVHVRYEVTQPSKADPAKKETVEQVTFHLYNADPSTLGIKETVHDGLTQLYESKTVDMKAGDSYTFRNLFFATDPGESRRCAIAPLGEGAVAIKEGDQVSVAGVGPAHLPGVLSTDASLFWAGAGHISLVEATHFEAPGIALSSSERVSLTLDLVRGELVVNPSDKPESVTLSTGKIRTSVEVKPGEKSVHLTGLPTPSRANRLRLALTAAWRQAGPEMKQMAAGATSSIPDLPVSTAWKLSGEDFRKLSQAAESGPSPGINVVRTQDLNGDGKAEILVGHTDHRLYCLNAEGHLKWSFAAPAQVWDISAGDVDGDGKSEVAFVCSASASDSAGSALYLLDSDGSERWNIPCPPSYWRWEMEGYPSPRSNGGPGPLLLCWIADLNGDGKKEIGCASRNFFVYFFDAQGKELWEVMNPYHRPLAWRIGDLNRDGKPEICVATDFATNLFSLTKTVPDENIGTGGSQLAGINQAGPALEIADLDGSGNLWLVHGTRFGEVAATEYAPSRPPGEPTWSYKVGATVDEVRVASLSGDGAKQILAVSRNMSVYCLDATGKVLWSRSLGEMVRSLAVEDLNGDGKPEILAGCDDGRIYHLSEKGDILGAMQLDSPVMKLLPAQLTPDGRHDLLASTREGSLYLLRWQK